MEPRATWIGAARAAISRGRSGAGISPESTRWRRLCLSLRATPIVLFVDRVLLYDFVVHHRFSGVSNAPQREAPMVHRPELGMFGINAGRCALCCNGVDNESLLAASVSRVTHRGPSALGYFTCRFSSRALIGCARRMDGMTTRRRARQCPSYKLQRILAMVYQAIWVQFIHHRTVRAYSELKSFSDIA